MRVKDATARSATYRRGTANMLVDPAAPHSSGGAVESISAACAERVDLEWVPEVEEPLVPTAQLVLCLSCPMRADCLATAVAAGMEGYWAGTTAADRRALASQGAISLGGADRLRREAAEALTRARAEETERALHDPDMGNMTWYGRGCRCPECRRANADKRAAQRRRRRLAAAGALQDAA